MHRNAGVNALRTCHELSVIRAARPHLEVITLWSDFSVNVKSSTLSCFPGDPVLAPMLHWRNGSIQINDRPVFLSHRATVSLNEVLHYK